MLVDAITIRSNVWPDIRITSTPAGGTPGPDGSGFGPVGDAALSVIQPAVYVDTVGGTIPLEPYGAPQTGLGAVVALGLLGGLGYVGYRIWKRWRRR